MQLQRGHYRTAGGHEAYISRIKARGMDFVVEGAIEYPDTGLLVISNWHINGRCRNEHPSARQFDILFMVSREQ